MQLAELLVAMAVLGLLLGPTVAVLQQGQRAWAIGAARVESQQGARGALARLAAEVRGAGLDPTGAGFAALEVAEPQRLVLRRDLDGDGRPDGHGESVTWRLQAGVLRRDAGAGGQPIVNGVQALEFVYLDGAGDVTTRPDAVRTVIVRLTTRPDHAPAGPAAPGVTTMVTAARLRNR